LSDMESAQRYFLVCPRRRAMITREGIPDFGGIRDYAWTAATYLSWAQNR